MEAAADGGDGVGGRGGRRPRRLLPETVGEQLPGKYNPNYCGYTYRRFLPQIITVINVNADTMEDAINIGKNSSRRLTTCIWPKNAKQMFFGGGQS